MLEAILRFVRLHKPHAFEPLVSRQNDWSLLIEP
jgi:hypothetical protein